MKIALCYTVFNATELLQLSIDQIKDQVDQVIICWQNQSNTGQFISPKDMQEVDRLSSEYTGVHYQVVPQLNPKENERRKHQLMIDTAKQLGCTHFLLSATDHFYDASDFKKAKQHFIENPVDVSFTKMFTYYKHPTWRLDPIEDYQMPFICKLYPETRIVSENNYPVRVDPSVRVSPAKSFRTLEIMMHHFSMVRENIRSKFENAAAAQNWPDKIEAFINEYENYDLKENVGVSYFKGRKIKVVEDQFKIGTFG